MGKPKGRFLGLNALTLQNPSDNPEDTAQEITIQSKTDPKTENPLKSPLPKENPVLVTNKQLSASLPKTTTGRRAKGLQPVPGGRARNPDYVTVTLYISPKLRKLLRFYLADHEDLSEITEKFLEDFVATRQAEETVITVTGQNRMR